MLVLVLGVAADSSIEYPSLASLAQAKLVHFAEFILSEAKDSVQAAREFTLSEAKGSLSTSTSTR